MQMPRPAYADGITKGKQTKFAGMNHNKGAKDGELYAMKNLCSDYYPLLATRPKRKLLRTLAAPNGLYAREKLCWVDGAGFYYDGIWKGEVTDGRKRFAAINDMILILPDMKYYDTAEDRFGELGAAVTAQGAGSSTSISTAPTKVDTFGAEFETIYAWTNREHYGSALVNLGTSLTVSNDRITGLNSISLTPLQEYIGNYICLYNSDDYGIDRVIKLEGYSESEGYIQFESGSLKDGTYLTPSGTRPYALYRSQPAAVRFEKHESEDGDEEQDPKKKNESIYLYLSKQQADWLNTFRAGGIIGITIGSRAEQTCTIVTMTYTTDAERGGYNLTIYIKGNPIETQTTSELVTITGEKVSDVVFSDGNTISCEGINWSEHLSEGDTVTVIDSSISVETVTLDENEQELTTTETVSNDGVYKVLSISGHSITVEGTLTNGTDAGSREYALGGEGVHFRSSIPSATLFEEGAIYCKGAGWEETFEAGEYVRISGCETEENNKSLMLRSVSERTAGFDGESFTPCQEEDGITVTRLHQHPFEFRDGTIYGVEAKANTVFCNSVTWADYFRAGDAISITGSSIAANNQTLIIREIDGHELRFYENSFTNGIDIGETIRFERDVPKLDFAFESENRLWGCKGNVIYVSKLGDPFNFNVYDGLDTDSFTVDTCGAGSFTAACAYAGYPTFFKEQKVYRVYGNKPSNYEVVQVATTGAAEGGGDSPAIAGETLFYLNRNGICVYAGGLPQVINRPFGTEKYKTAVGGSDGLKYYASMEDSAGNWHLFVYDTQQGLWHEEDENQAVGFVLLDGVLYGLMADGKLCAMRWAAEEPEGTEEDDFNWFAEFADYTDESANKKGVSKIQIRMELEENASCTIKLRFDSVGEWIVPNQGVIDYAADETDVKRSYYLAIIPHRADHYKLRLEGRGGCRIYSIAIEYYEGSELKSRSGRQ